MSKIACVWVDLADDTDAEAKYEDEHIPSVIEKIGGAARNCDAVEENIFKEVEGIHGKFVTLYELDPAAEDVHARVSPDIKHLPKNTLIETRTYHDDAVYPGEEWRGEHSDIQMFLIVLWQPEEAVHDEVLEWFINDFAAGMRNPDLLRLRVLKLEQVSTIENGEYKEKSTKGMYQYMSIWDFAVEELPWEIMVYLGSSEGWRHYVEGKQLKWQIGQYLVSRVYPDEEGGERTNSPTDKEEV